MANLTEFLSFHARRTPGRTALAYNGAEISYAEMMARAHSGARWLAERGIGKGDVVALLMKNSAAFFDLVFAVSHQGAVLLPINYRLAANEIEYILSNASATLLIADQEFEDVTSQLPEGSVESIFLLDSSAQADIRSVVVTSGSFPPAHCSNNDLMRLVYTSGTTSRPKGVMHAYEQFYWKHLSLIPPLELSGQTRLLIVGPLYHVGGLELPGLSVLALGGMIALEREFEPERALAAIERYHLNGAWFAPTMTNMILALPSNLWVSARTLNWVIGGGERTPEARIRSFSEAFPEARYIDAYGLTESNSGDTFMEPGMELLKIGSTGRAAPHLEVEIRDESGKTLTPGQDGEICLRGRKITSGYWNDELRTKEAFFSDGWFRTGDIGYLDEEGFLFLTDRKKDMILSGGENIASSEVERVIYEMPEVLEAAVIAGSDPKWGEVPVAIVTPRPGSKVTLESLQAHCRKSLAGFKTPKRLVIKESLPRNPSGKVLKRVLREEIEA
jgi:fatty-acyl-CoA synthase